MPNTCACTMPRISELDPLPWQTEFLRAGLSGDWPSDAAAVRGGLGSGKSLALCALAILICETRPGALVVVGMDTFRRLRDVHLSDSPILRLKNRLAPN